MPAAGDWANGAVKQMEKPVLSIQQAIQAGVVLVAIVGAHYAQTRQIDVVHGKLNTLITVLVEKNVIKGPVSAAYRLPNVPARGPDRALCVRPSSFSFTAAEEAPERRDSSCFCACCFSAEGMRSASCCLQDATCACVRARRALP